MNKTFEKILERLEERRKFHKRLISYEQNGRGYTKLIHKQ